MAFESPPPELFEGVDMDALGMDQAYLRVYNDDFQGAPHLYGRSDDCDKCPFQSYGVVCNAKISQIASTSSGNLIAFRVMSTCYHHSYDEPSCVKLTG